MILTNKRRRELEEQVQGFCGDNNLNMQNDLFQELDKIGFVVHSAKFKRPLSGLIGVNENVEKLTGFKSNKVIIYNSDSDLYELRFIVLHELSHYISKKNEANGANVLFGARDHTIGYSDNIDEQEKDYMAAALLIPCEEFASDIVTYLNQSGYSINDFSEVTEAEINKLVDDNYFIQSAQKKYRAGEELTKRRIKEVFGVKNGTDT